MSYDPSVAPTRASLEGAYKKKKVLVISGPTAVGKSALALLIAKKLGGEIISADSMQVYMGMDIGTAKPSLDERLEIPHHLIDVQEVFTPFNVAQFYHAAIQAIDSTLARGNVPIVVGGTGFYLHALLYGPPTGPPSNPAVRKSLEEELKKGGVEALYLRLKALDPDYAATITEFDRVKIVRALEIMQQTGQMVSEFKVASESSSLYDFHSFFLYYPRDILYPRIEMRCDEMIAKGFVLEVENLLKRGILQNSSASLAIGYRQCLTYLASCRTSDDFEQFIWDFKLTSRRYAKRQFTWFRKEPLFRWLNLQEMGLDGAMEFILNDFLSSL